ncbi:MAG: hypothetical protein KatS3mg091_053 [Patescibacteria group bacterium]|nr:MAG: hypothetical protein KatS3mg091_053 [Patescibacteria group bacterium]
MNTKKPKQQIQNPWEKLEQKKTEENQFKAAAKDIVDAFNPINWFQEIIGIPRDQQMKSQEELKKEFEEKNSTQLDPEKLSKAYKEKDEESAEKIQAKIQRHKQLRQEEEAYLEEKKQREKAERQRQLEEEAKKKQEEEKRREEEQQLPMPQGKQRRSILQGLVKKRKAINPFEYFRGEKK